MLDRVNFSHADMRETRFQGAEFNHAKLTGARLADTDLRGASFVETDLTNIDLSRTLVASTRGITEASIRETIGAHLEWI